MARRRRTRRRRRRSPRRRDSWVSALLALVALALVAAWAVDEFPDASDGAGTATTGPPGPGPPPSRPPSGGDPPAGGSAVEVLDTLVVAPEAGAESYEREAFGEALAAERAGCDVREQVLADESMVPATRNDDDCQVVSGRWVSLYDNYATDDPDELEVDHVVALAEAWESGASRWSSRQREAFATDTARPDALIAVTVASNQSKSDRDPAEWMPSHRGAWCRYATAWVTQKAAWHLTVDRAERDALRNVLAACPAT